MYSSPVDRQWGIDYRATGGFMLLFCLALQPFLYFSFDLLSFVLHLFLFAQLSHCVNNVFDNNLDMLMYWPVQLQ